MRQIKFKAKRLDNGEWIEGTPICINGKPYGIMIGEKESPDIDPSTVCQFTGEKDMRGKEIYIGDIISNLETGSVIEVVWNDRLKRLDCKFLNADKGLDVPFGIFITRYKRIVVLMSKFDKEK